MLINSQKIISLRLLGVMVGMSLLLGCQDSDMPDLRAFVNDAYKNEKPELEPLPVNKPYTGYKYSASGESDPFDQANIILDKDRDNGFGGERPDGDRQKEPLESFPLDALSMVGTLVKEEEPWVAVKTSKGTVLLAKVGNYMGENDGKIKEISPEEQRVVLSEIILDQSGRWVSRDVEITINEQ